MKNLIKKRKLQSIIILKRKGPISLFFRQKQGIFWGIFFSKKLKYDNHIRKN